MARGASARIVVLATTVLLGVSGQAETVPRPLPAGHLSGVSLAMSNRPERGYDSARARCMLEDLAARGVNAVSLMPFAFQKDPRSGVLEVPDERMPNAESPAQLRAGIRAAHARGLAVLLKPQIFVPRSWPGAILPASEVAFRAWWARYRSYVLGCARLAAEERVAGFCVGTELSLLQSRSEWRALVAEVRSLYPGFVVYAANWDAVDVPFADLLDACGVDLYEPLSADPEATDEALSSGARRIVARLDALSARARRPVLLTEVGFAARERCWQRPNEERGAVDESAQRRATRALLTALEGSNGVKGLFWWKAFSDGAAARPDEGSFRITGRPAEAELVRFFQRRIALAGAPRQRMLTN